MEIVNQDLGISSGYNKRTRKESQVWRDMTKRKGEDGKVWAICRHCEKRFDGSSKKGTTHLKNHLQRCPKRKNGDGDGGGDADKSMKNTIDVTSPDVFKEKSVVDLIKMSLVDWKTSELDLSEIELLSSELNSRKIGILQVYKEEKEKLSEFLNNLSCRFTLRIKRFEDLYILTVHYIDDSWEPRWKIISCLKTTGFGYANLVAALKESCLDLKIDGNICSIIIGFCDDTGDMRDWASFEDVIGDTDSWSSQRPSLPAGGPLIDIASFYECFKTSSFTDWYSCSGLNRCIDYVNKTESNKQNFGIAVQKVKSMGKKVWTPQFLPWNINSFFGFKKAVGYKEAFCELEHIDPDFKSINLTKEEWDDATFISEHLDEFLDSVISLFDSEYTTPNLYFPKFCDVYMKLLPRQRIEGYRLGESALHLLASMRKTFFDGHWRVMVITVVLDPRFKMEIVRLWYNKIYGDDADSYLEKIEDDFVNVYNEYASRGSTPSISYLDAMGRPRTSSKGVSSKSELDRYLNDDPKCPPYEKLDILAWWRANAEIYPTLARMARDFLAVPITFTLSDMYDHVIDWNVEYLDDDIKAAWVCLTNWL